MSAHDNKEFARKLYQLFSEDRIDEALEMAADDVEVVLYPFGQTFHGREGFREFMMGFKGAFPDITISEIAHQVASEDDVVTEFTARGTHTGPMATPAGELPPTGRPVTFTVCEVWRVENGKLASLHNAQDAASIMRQLGVA